VNRVLTGLLLPGLLAAVAVVLVVASAVHDHQRGPTPTATTQPAASPPPEPKHHVNGVVGLVVLVSGLTLVLVAGRTCRGWRQ
jgi:hypothetical protein